MTRTRDVVEVVARALTDQPDRVVVTETERHDSTRIALKTGPGDLGKVIGRQGRTAAAVRALATTTAELDGQLVTVDFLDE